MRVPGPALVRRCARLRKPTKEAAMLGEIVAESSGQVAGVRVLVADGLNSRVEVSLRGEGRVLGTAMTDTATYEQIVRPDGTLYGEGQVLMILESGEMAAWRGFGVGQPTGRPPAGSFGVAGAFHGASGELARLGKVATVIEYDVSEDGTYRWTMWEWTGPQRA
jgi:hypothetical protein